jgi:hypothetical protein
LLSVGWDNNISGFHCHCSADTNSLFSQALHVKRKATLSLHLHHAVIIGPNPNHVFQGLAKGVWVKARVPISHGIIIIIEDPK